MCAQTKQTRQLPELSSLHRPLMPVPWDKADSWLMKLRDQGMQVTACYYPSNKTAGLEFPVGTDLENIRKFLDAVPVLTLPSVAPAANHAVPVLA